MDGDGYPFWSYWDNIRTWWEIRHLPNVMLLHYADLKADLRGNIKKIAEFIGEELDEETFDKVYEHSTFDWMKANGDKAAPLAGVFWDSFAVFFNKGFNGYWREELPESESDRYVQIAKEKLGEECAAWLLR